MRKSNRKNGFTMVEMVVLIVVIGIIMSIAAFNMERKIESAKFDTAISELGQIARAVRGNHGLYSEQTRTDFGYLGDIGALPDSIGDLLANTKGYTTWNGPYLYGGSEEISRLDPWGAEYLLNDSTVLSIGSGDTISMPLGNSSGTLVNNSISMNIRDAAGRFPGIAYADSVEIHLYYPDGAGDIAESTGHPSARGAFSRSGIPAGVHTLELIYLPDSDTLQYSVSIAPGESPSLDIIFPAELWY